MDDIKLFVKRIKKLETLIQAVKIKNDDVGMELGIENYAMLIMKRQMTEGIRLGNEEKLRKLREKETYRYLGILKEDIKNVEMKEKIQNSILGERENY